MVTSPPDANALLRCQSCRQTLDASRPIWVCPCGGLLDVEMPPGFPWEIMRARPPGLWRYGEVLPIGLETTPVTLGEAATPLLAIDERRCRLFLKLDFLFPTGSFKDRGAAVLMTKARELGVREVLEDSSGNAGAAVAAYAAAAGIQATVFVPESSPQAKTGPIALYGARLVRVPGPRAAATAAALQAAGSTYYASHAWNPFFFEGTKTIAFEIWEQLGYRVPDWVITPVGHGTMLLGLYKGFETLRKAGRVERLPRIVGVQAAACAPLVQICAQGLPELPELLPGPTLADGIVVSRPVRWRQILMAVEASTGQLMAVAEQDIGRAWRRWASRGLLMEPTSAAALAGLAQLLETGNVTPADTVVVPITGSGLKTVDKIPT